MIKQLSTRLTQIIGSSSTLNDQQQEQLSYMVTVILSDTSKLLLITLIFSVFGYFPDIVLMVLLSTPLRIHLGGFHMKTYWSCFSFSLSYYFVIFALAQMLVMPTYVPILIAIGCIPIIWLIAPIVPKQRFTIAMAKKKQMRFRALVLMCIYIILAFYTKNHPYMQYSMWVIIVQTALLIWSKGVKLYEQKTT